MATTVTITLSKELQQTLSSTTGGGKVGVWAVYFTNDGKTAHATPLAVDATTPKPPTAFELPLPYNGGKIYFLVQSTSSAADLLTFGPGGDITTESQINWTTASNTAHPNKQFRYDSFEVSLLGQAADAGNLTNVNSFGFPMSVAITYPNGAVEQTRGYKVNGESIFDDIGAAFPSGGGLIHNFAAGPLAGSHREAAGPATVLSTSGLTGASASDFYGYLESIGNLAANKVQIAGQFNGAATVEYVLGSPQSYGEWHNAAFYSYTMSYEAAPLTVHQGSSALGANPFSVTKDQAAITVTDPHASQYKVGDKVSFSGVPAFGGFTVDQLNTTFTIANVTDANHYVVFTNPQTNATETLPHAGGDHVLAATPLGSNPFSATAGQKFFTVTDPNAHAYANTGVEVTFAGVSSFDPFPGLDFNTTKFTITKVVSETSYEVATTVAASHGAVGGGSAVAPTYVRPHAGTFVFTPTDNSQVKGTIRISSADLANSIYSTLGNAEILSPNGTPYQFTALNSSNVGVATTNLNTGANDQWGALFVKLLTGLLGGYIGGEGAASNHLLGPAGALDFSQNWNFDPTFAFHANMAKPWTWDPATYGAGAPFDKYAQVFFDNTNSYGNGYSDGLMSLFQEGGPLMSSGYPVPLAANPYSTTKGSNIVTVHDPHVGQYGYKVGDLVTFAGGSPVAGITMTAAPLIAGTGVNAFTIKSVDVAAGTYTVEATTVASDTTTGGGTGVVAGLNVTNIAITLYDDHETPPTGQTLQQHQQYTQTEIYNTYYPSLGALVAPRGDGHSSDLDLQFGLGLGQMRPRDDLTVKLGFFKETINNVASFDYVTFDTKGQSLFQTWDYSSSNGGTFVPKGTPAASGTSLQINDLPYVTGVNWYQLVFEDTASQIGRTYNLYLDAAKGAGVLNPGHQGNAAGAVAIDGLATYVNANTTDQHLTSLVFNMFSGGTLSMDPSLLAQITDKTVIDANWPTAAAPVLGTLGGSGGTTFANWGGSAASATPNGPNSLQAPLAVDKSSLAFGWFGADNTWLTNSLLGGHSAVIGSYTNKIGALNYAEVTFESGAGLTTRNPIQAVVAADVDGKWVTPAGTFSNGTYKAVFQEYADDKFATSLSKLSAPVVFTVDVPKLDLGGAGTDAITLVGDGSSADGNWLTLTVANSTLPNGTLLAYATDSVGNLIGRDGQVGASLADAVRAQIGAVALDDGTSVMFSGTHSVYLPVDLQLRFAILSGDGSIEQLPNTSVSGADVLAVGVSGAAGLLNFTALVDNTLSSNATLAEAQRTFNQPFVYLTQGQDVNVAVAGSAYNNNTIHFVRMDLDAATGALSVAGVAYGNTDAFRQAVQDNWDPNFVASGGRGNFNANVGWDVSTGTGYYTPVLLTESGDVFVVGTANVDGQSHIRMYGQNTFGFEDLRADLNSDFDYNDLVVRVTTS